MADPNVRLKGIPGLVELGSREGKHYSLFQGIILTEEDPEECHRESVRLSEEDALTVHKGMPITEVRKLMYKYSPYA